MKLPSERATEVVNERQGTYGHPGPIMVMWTGMLGHMLGRSVKPEEGPLMLLLLKVCREVCGESQEDNPVDMAGYANVYVMVREYLNG